MGWAQETDGGLPDGIPELSNALQDDLRDNPHDYRGVRGVRPRARRRTHCRASIAAAGLKPASTRARQPPLRPRVATSTVAPRVNATSAAGHRRSPLHSRPSRGTRARATGTRRQENQQLFLAHGIGRSRRCAMTTPAPLYGSDLATQTTSACPRGPIATPESPP